MTWKALSPQLIKYFSSVIEFPEKEIKIAEKAAKIFSIKSWLDLWKIKAVVRYKPEPAEGAALPHQLLQDLGTTLYYLQGDCEDIARAQIAVARYLDIPAYFLMMFPDTSYKNGHVCVIGLTDKGNLFLLDATHYYVETSIQLTTKDIQRAEYPFIEALSRIVQDLRQYKFFWVVHLDYTARGYLQPQKYLEPSIVPTYGNVEKITYPDDPTQFSNEIKLLGYDLESILGPKTPELPTYAIIFLIILFISTLVLLIRR